MNAECYDCKLPYEYFADVVLPNEIWAKIAPKDGEGLLCFNCMNTRLQVLGLSDVPFKVTSGAFARNQENTL